MNSLGFVMVGTVYGTQLLVIHNALEKLLKQK